MVEGRWKVVGEQEKSNDYCDCFFGDGLDK